MGSPGQQGVSGLSVPPSPRAHRGHVLQAERGFHGKVSLQSNLHPGRCEGPEPSSDSPWACPCVCLQRTCTINVEQPRNAPGTRLSQPFNLNTEVCQLWPHLSWPPPSLVTTFHGAPRSTPSSTAGQPGGSALAPRARPPPTLRPSAQKHRGDPPGRVPAWRAAPEGRAAVGGGARERYFKAGGPGRGQRTGPPTGGARVRGGL